jgi:hypothetical protein
VWLKEESVWLDEESVWLKEENGRCDMASASIGTLIEQIDSAGLILKVQRRHQILVHVATSPCLQAIGQLTNFLIPP